MRNIRGSFKASTSGLPSHDRWLLSYADFVTLLLAVFVVLFASMRHNRGSIRTMSTAIHSGFDSLGVGSASRPQVSDSSVSAVQTLGPPPGDASELVLQLQEVFGDAISKREAIVQLTPEGLLLRLQDLGFFESGNAALLPTAVRELRNTARVLERYNLEVRVEGHSDDRPIRTTTFHSNWELSTARAMSVLSVLVNQAGFPADRIAVMGYGSYRPIADNATEDGRQKNRRVDLVIVMPHAAQDHHR